ncbi:MAG: hypothetical protein AAFW74_05625 [Pseudomonadota bacterium]
MIRQTWVRNCAATFGMAGLAANFQVLAQDPIDNEFEEGGVVAICGRPVGGPDLSSEAFLAGFPEWITSLQVKANEGVIERAHYLGTIKEGVFIVFKGPDRAQAMSSAKEVTGQLKRVYTEVTGNESKDEICRFYEIGPVAVLPM